MSRSCVRCRRDWGSGSTDCPNCGGVSREAFDAELLAADGGENSEGSMDATLREASSTVFSRWMGQAAENIDEWGLQDEETLLLAIQEELGELTQAFLEARSEGGDPARIFEELEDLGALLLQLHDRRRGGEDGA